MSFNSTLVRLEDACVLSSGFEAGFQFHFGTIRRITVCPDGQPGALFQFHFGTIRRTILYTLRSSQRSFNSTLVRLEVISLLVMSLLWQKFQFHFGTIRSILISQDNFAITEFQFHFGTIRSCKKKSIFGFKPRFNSTLVRLEEWRSVSEHGMTKGFNSTLVRLEELFCNLSSKIYFVSIPLWYD